MSSSGGDGGTGDGAAAAAAASGLAAADSASVTGGGAVAAPADVGIAAQGDAAGYGFGSDIGIGNSATSSVAGYPSFGQNPGNAGFPAGYASVSSDARGTVSATPGDASTNTGYGSDTGMGSIGNAYGQAVGTGGFVGQPTSVSSPSPAGSGFGVQGGFGTNSVGDAQGVTGGKFGGRVGGGFANASQMGNTGGANAVSTAALVNPAAMHNAALEVLRGLGGVSGSAPNIGFPAFGINQFGQNVDNPPGISNAGVIGGSDAFGVPSFGQNALSALDRGAPNAAVNQGIAADRGVSVPGFPYGVSNAINPSFNPNATVPGIPDLGIPSYTDHVRMDGGLSPIPLARHPLPPRGMTGIMSTVPPSAYVNTGTIRQGPAGNNYGRY